MPDLNVIAGSVEVVITANGSLIPTISARGIAGVTITPGQVVYADPTANNLIKLAQANTQFQATSVVGFSLGSVAPNQPITYATGGDVLLATAALTSGTLVSGSVYVASHGTAGGIGSPYDLAAGDFVTVIGVANGPTAIRLGLIPAGAVHG